jgi:hypothetical protein
MIFDVFWLLGEESDIDDIDTYRYRISVEVELWESHAYVLEPCGGCPPGFECKEEQGQKLYGAFLTFWLRVLRQCDGAKTAW